MHTILRLQWSNVKKIAIKTKKALREKHTHTKKKTIPKRDLRLMHHFQCFFYTDHIFKKKPGTTEDILHDTRLQQFK